MTNKLAKTSNTMKVVLAFDSYKGALSATAACAAAAVGLLRLSPPPEIVSCPLSDGGEGFAECMRLAGNGRAQEVQVTGPLFQPVRAEIVWLDDETAVIEAAQACGLGLIPPQLRSPMHTTTRGLGEMMAAAVDAGAKRLVIGLGGSGTNDAGIGMLDALGWVMRDANGNQLPPTGTSLAAIHSIDTGRSFAGVTVIASCDVQNPLSGPTGAACVYAPQKGASAQEVAELDHGLHHFAQLCAATFGEDLSTTHGAGAAGGLGFALQLFFNAEFQPGAEVAINLAHLREQLVAADLCLTGEGCTDYQTAYGKLPAAVGACCRTANVPCVCLSGVLGEDWRQVYDTGITAVCSITPGPASLQEAIANTATNLADTAEAVARLTQRMR